MINYLIRLSHGQIQREPDEKTDAKGRNPKHGRGVEIPANNGNIPGKVAPKNQPWPAESGKIRNHNDISDRSLVVNLCFMFKLYFGGKFLSSMVFLAPFESKFRAGVIKPARLPLRAT
jgi:hypothetical protein